MIGVAFLKIYLHKFVEEYKVSQRNSICLLNFQSPELLLNIISGRAACLNLKGVPRWPVLGVGMAT